MPTVEELNIQELIAKGKLTHQDVEVLAKIFVLPGAWHESSTLNKMARDYEKSAIGKASNLGMIVFTPARSGGRGVSIRDLWNAPIKDYFGSLPTEKQVRIRKESEEWRKRVYQGKVYPSKKLPLREKIKRVFQRFQRRK